jgi:hypothetical protein
LELLQNLDDTPYADGVQPAVSFNLHGRKLVVESNQIGFTEKDVDAICSLGNSSKVPVEGVIKETTGEKGIGCVLIDSINSRLPLDVCRRQESSDIFEWFQF